MLSGQRWTALADHSQFQDSHGACAGYHPCHIWHVSGKLDTLPAGRTALHSGACVLDKGDKTLHRVRSVVVLTVCSVGLWL